MGIKFTGFTLKASAFDIASSESVREGLSESIRSRIEGDLERVTSYVSTSLLDYMTEAEAAGIRDDVLRRVSDNSLEVLDELSEIGDLVRIDNDNTMVVLGVDSGDLDGVTGDAIKSFSSYTWYFYFVANMLNDLDLTK